MTNKYVVPLILIVLILLSMMFFVKALLHTKPLDGVEEKGKQVVETSEEDVIRDRKMNYDDAVEKNIFHPERIFVEPQSQNNAQFDETQVPQVMPQIVVKGIVQRPDGEFIAYISREGEKTQPIHVGDRVENIKVVSITLTDVTIKWNNSDITLSLKKIKTVQEKNKK